MPSLNLKIGSYLPCAAPNAVIVTDSKVIDAKGPSQKTSLAPASGATRPGLSPLASALQNAPLSPYPTALCVWVMTVISSYQWQSLTQYSIVVPGPKWPICECQDIKSPAVPRPLPPCSGKSSLFRSVDSENPGLPDLSSSGSDNPGRMCQMGWQGQWPLIPFLHSFPSGALSPLSPPLSQRPVHLQQGWKRYKQHVTMEHPLVYG